MKLCSEAKCGRACGPGETVCRKHGGNPMACGICGSLTTCDGHRTGADALEAVHAALDDIRNAHAAECTCFWCLTSRRRPNDRPSRQRIDTPVTKP